MESVDEPVEVVAARPEWAWQAESLRSEVCRVLDIPGTFVAHIGSTAVPGLAAKPVIDLLVGCADDRRTSLADQLAEGAGYEYLREASAPGREYLRRRTQRPPSNVHVVEVGGVLWRDNLSLRDFLRADSDAAAEYAAAKRAAAVRHGRLLAYSAAKAGTVRALLARARRWSDRQV